MIYYFGLFFGVIIFLFLFCSKTLREHKRKFFFSSEWNVLGGCWGSIGVRIWVFELQSSNSRRKKKLMSCCIQTTCACIFVGWQLDKTRSEWSFLCNRGGAAAAAAAGFSIQRPLMAPHWLLTPVMSATYLLFIQPSTLLLLSIPIFSKELIIFSALIPFAPALRFRKHTAMTPNTSILSGYEGWLKWASITLHEGCNKPNEKGINALKPIF